jgi:hypothetical protein
MSSGFNSSLVLTPAYSMSLTGNIKYLAITVEPKIPISVPIEGQIRGVFLSVSTMMAEVKVITGIKIIKSRVASIAGILKLF